MQVKTQEQVDFYNYLVIQAIVFGNLQVDPKNTTFDFLYLLERQIEFYKEQSCLSDVEKNQICHLINQVRFHSGLEDFIGRSSVWNWCNEQIGKVNQTTDEYYENFILNRLRDYNYKYIGKRKYYHLYVKQYLPALRSEITEMCHFWSLLNSENFYSNVENMTNLIKNPDVGYRISILLKQHPNMLDDIMIEKLMSLLLIKIKILSNKESLSDEFEARININDQISFVCEFQKEEMEENINTLKKIYHTLSLLQKKNNQLKKVKK